MPRSAALYSYRPYIPYYNMRASNPATAPRTEWLARAAGAREPGAVAGYRRMASPK